MSIPELPPIELPQHTVVLYDGEFGRQVLAACNTSAATTFETPGPVYPGQIPYASLIIAIWPGHRRVDRERIDMVGFQRGIPTLGLELLPTSVVCGPVVRPGDTACYECYERRLSQHQKNVVTMLENTVGLAEGFGPAEVAVGTGMLGRALELLEHPEPQQLGADVFSFDLALGSTSRAVTVAVDRCSRCSNRFAQQRHPTAALQNLVRR